jgi:cytochrome c
MLAAAVWLATIALSPPSFGADAANGAQLAQVWCVSCHVFPGASDGPTLQGPPSFRAIAHGGKTPNQLRVFLEQPHGSMPPLSLSRSEIGDLLAYIDSLR